MAINIDEYLKDIESDQVCGEDLQYDPVFIELEQAIKGKPEQQMGDTIVEAEPPNWREIKNFAESLLERSIDLRVLISYLRALIALQGYTGLQDGLTLIRTLIEHRWENIHPQLDPEDDNDPTERINVLMTLSDYETLLKPLQQTPLLESKAVGQFNFRDVCIASGKSTATSNEKAINQSTIDAAIQADELEHLQRTFQAISESLDNLNQLETLITDFVGISDAPSFADLRSLLKDSKQFIGNALAIRGIGDASIDLEQSTESDDVIVPAKLISGNITNNQDVIKTLNLVCDYYKKYEPSSPVPFFIDRAIRLVGKNFIDAMKDIAPTGFDEAIIILGKQHDEQN